MEFKTRLKQLRKENSWTQKELSEKVSLTKSMISMYENGRRKPSYEALEELADTFNVSIDYLTGASNDNGRIKQDSHPLPTNIIPLQKSRRIPILGTIACGDPIFAQENFDGYFIADSTIKADFCLYAKGDSMIGAGIEDGDVAFIRKQEAVETGEIAAVLLPEANEATLKRVYIKDDYILLQPDNPSYAPIMVKEDVRILGKLVGIYHDVE